MNPSKNILEKFEEKVPLVKEIFSATKDTKGGVEKNTVPKTAETQKTAEQLTPIAQAKETITKTRQSLESLQAHIATGYNADDVEKKVGALLASMEQIDLADKVAVKRVLDGMHDKSIDAKQSLEQTIGLLHDIEEKTEHLTEADAEKINDTKTGIASTQSQLDLLEHAVTVDDAVRKTEEKAFIAVQDELKSKRRCPNWLADKIHEYLTVKYIQKKEVEGFRGKAGGIMTGVLGFALGAKWKTFFTALESGNSDALKGAMNAFDFVKEKFAGVKDDAGAVVDAIENGDLKKKVKEVSREEIEKQKTAFSGWLKLFVKKNFKVDMDDTKVAAVMQKIEFEKMMHDGSENIQEVVKFWQTQGKEGQDANYLHAAIDAVTLPFGMAYKVTNALVDIGVISAAKVGMTVTKDAIHYGTRGFQLFGTGLDVVLGRVDMKDVGNTIATLYDKTPDVANELLYAYIYRNAHGPLAKGLSAAGATVSKLALYFAIDAGDDAKGIKNSFREALQGKVTTSLDEFKEFADILKKKGIQGPMASLVTEHVNSLERMVAATGHVQDVFQEAKTIGLSGWNEAASQKLVKQMDAVGAHNTQWQSMRGKFVDASGKFLVASEDAVRMTLASTLEGVVKTEATLLAPQTVREKISSSGVRAAQGEAGMLSMAYDTHHEFQHIAKTYANAMGQKGRFKGLKGTLSEAKLGFLTGLKAKEVAGRSAFFFENAKSFEDFAEKLKYLGKQSPDAAKFLIGKMPVFLIAGMEFSKDAPVMEKIKSLRTLLPIVGPMMILEDATDAKDFSAGQAALGGALITYDTVQLVKFAAKRDALGALKYVGQPLVDIYETGVFLREGIRKGGVILGDAVRLAGESKGVVAAGETFGSFMMKNGRLGRLGLTALVVGGVGYGIHSLTSSDGLDKETQAMVDKYKDKPEELDKDIAKQRPTLPQADRNDYLRAAVLRLGGFSPEQMGSIDVTYDATKKEYGCVLPTVVNKDAVDALKNRLQTAVTQLDGAATVRTYFHERALVQFRELLTQQYKDQSAPEQTTSKQAYVTAMGYDAIQAKSIIG